MRSLKQTAIFSLAVIVSAGSVAFGEESAAAVPALTFGHMQSLSESVAKAKVENWLKANKTFDDAKFNAVWKDAHRTVRDRAVASLLLAKPELAKEFDRAENKLAPAPTAVPAELTNDKLDPFVRSNLAAAYARALAGRQVYEESLVAAKAVQPELLIDPAGFYFYKAVAEHALIKRDEATSSILHLIDDVTDAPDRYRLTATMMYFDLQSWSRDEKSLENIGKLMDNSGRRLELARGGKQTQEIQKKIVFRLDEKIKELESQCKGGQCNGGSCPNGSKPGSGAGSNPSAPMQDSFGGGATGKGEVDDKKLREIAAVWGKLPEAERKKITTEISRDLPPKYKPMIENYFKSLNQIHGFK